MGCGCGGAAAGGGTKFELTRPDGSKTIYPSMTEARIALQQAGGGTILAVAG